MQTIAITLLVSSTLLTFVIVYWYFTSQTRRAEGFQDSVEPPTQADLGKILSTIRRLGSSLMDMNVWKERIAFSQMTPTELARAHLNGGG